MGWSRSICLLRRRNICVARVNAVEADRTQQAKLLKRSLALLHVEIGEKKLATSAPLRREYEKRARNAAKSWRNINCSGLM